MGFFAATSLRNGRLDKSDNKVYYIVWAPFDGLHWCLRMMAIDKELEKVFLATCTDSNCFNIFYLHGNTKLLRCITLQTLSPKSGCQVASVARPPSSLPRAASFPEMCLLMYIYIHIYIYIYISIFITIHI